MNTRLVAVIAVLTVFLGSFALIAPAHATTACTFTTVGTKMMLNGDCTTDASILVPDGFTLDGRGHTITAIDPPGGHFVGAVVANGGATAHVKNLIVTTYNLANVCDGGDNRLRGIMFKGASGSISRNIVMNINQGASGCQEGNAIEITNAPYDGTHPNTKIVDISNNKITDYQKTGIVANGDVSVTINNNQIGASATQANLAANSVQLGFGALGSIKHNIIDGNQWYGPSNYVATAILLYAAGNGVEVVQNNIRGNADVGIYVYTDNAKIDNNKVFDDPTIPDTNLHGDYGIGNWGENNSITNNKVRDYDTPYDDVTGGNNKVIPGGPID